MNDIFHSVKSKNKEKSIVSRFANFRNQKRIKSDIKYEKNNENKNNIRNSTDKSYGTFVQLEKINEMISMMTLERTRKTTVDHKKSIQPTIPCNIDNPNINGTPYVADTNSNSQRILDNEIKFDTYNTQDFSTVKEYGVLVKKNPPIPKDIINVNNTVYNFERSSDDTSYGHSNSEEDFNRIPKDLRNMIDIFNCNDQGLIMELKSDQIMGKLRIYINLLRPIKMLLITRPPLTFDLSLDNDRDCNHNTIAPTHYTKEVTIWLPRGSTNLLYVNINCLTAEVISILLRKFNIRNNPQTYGLYEHTITFPDKVEIRKLRLCECPLKIMLGWCTEDIDFYHQNLSTKKFVLQENDSGLIEWNEFSIPELKSFLMILSEEQEYQKEDIILKYEALRADISRLMTIDHCQA